ncbi:MAG TPA: hypothetical protein VIO95_11140 [Mycobacterium sp.]
MTQPPPQQPVPVVQGVLDQIAATATAAAQEIDAGTFSLDDRIKAMHQLFELSVQGWAALVQAAVSGPAFGVQWNAAPAPSDPIPVNANQTYPRYIEVATSFAQVGNPALTIPNNQIQFIPQVLQVGATQFQMAVTDPNLSARSYYGAVRLTTVTPGGTPTSTEIVTIDDVEL